MFTCKADVTPSAKMHFFIEEVSIQISILYKKDERYTNVKIVMMKKF
jgi:hypothetical protein